MIYTDKELGQMVIEYCAVFGLAHVVISPGSRNAPLIIGFSNQDRFKCYSIVDERSAAFFALGMAQQLQQPVAVVCTSGSALLNYYPAVAEAFYSDIPLVVISADRPRHLIDIGDGQAIRQENVFSNHSLYNANLVDNDSSGFNEKVLEEALVAAINRRGPVHINVPFDEPIYGTSSQLLVKAPQPIEVAAKGVEDLSEFTEIWNSVQNKLVIVGSHIPDLLLQEQLSALANDPSVLILTETNSNCHDPKFINSIDKLIFPFTEEECKNFCPDVLITLGGMIVSKKIKQILRKFSPKHHWHIDDKTALDTYHCLTKHFIEKPTVFFKIFLETIIRGHGNYQANFTALMHQRKENHIAYLNMVQFSDLKVFDVIFKSLPKNTQLQLGNSTVIRYSQLFDLDSTLEVYCNRGTSGIDGCTSTAIGAAFISAKQTVFISGDISFFYDSNALWNKNIPEDFRIILINNSGGNIFKFIPGPQASNALTFFEAPHQLTAEHVCAMHHVTYARASSEWELHEQLLNFYNESSGPKLLEIFTPSDYDSKVLKDYFRSL